jgi:hypothetical protein
MLPKCLRQTLPTRWQWHTQERYEYPPEARIIIHPDDWRWRRHERYVWREHQGRGFWLGGRWVEFEK